MLLVTEVGIIKIEGRDKKLDVGRRETTTMLENE